MSSEKRDRSKRVDDTIEHVHEEADEIIHASKTAGSEVREEVHVAISDVEARIDKPRNRPGE